jgi:hypothetical protein
MTDTDKVFLGVAFVALAAIVIYNRMGVPISVSPMAAGTVAPNEAAPPATPMQGAYMTDVRPWGAVPPLTPMMNRSAGVMGIPERHWTMDCGGRCN